MATMTQVFQEARALPTRDRARLVCKLIAVDQPSFLTDDSELARREEDVRLGRVRRTGVAGVMREARMLAGVHGQPPTLKPRKG